MEAHAAPDRFAHVFLIVGENTSYEQITARHAPFLVGTIEARGARVTDYHAFRRSSSLGQYVAMVSGQFTRCEAHNDPPDHCHQPARSLFAQLAASDTSAFDAALQSGAVGDFNLVVPNDCENGHDPCGTRDPVRQFDDFLSREVPRIEASPAFGNDGTILITWDEGADPPRDPGHVLLAAVGPLVRPGAVDRARHDHYGLERTLAEGLGVAPLAHARKAAPIASIWR